RLANGRHVAALELLSESDHTAPHLFEDALILDEVDVPFERLLRSINERFCLVFELGKLASFDVARLELVGLVHQAIDVVGGETAGRRDAHVLDAPGPEIFRLDTEDAVAVDAKRHLDLRHAARRGWNTGQLETREASVVDAHFALALQNVDRDE